MFRVDELPALPPRVKTVAAEFVLVRARVLARPLTKSSVPRVAGVLPAATVRVPPSELLPPRDKVPALTVVGPL